jgi:hypothetical protein
MLVAGRQLPMTTRTSTNNDDDEHAHHACQYLKTSKLTSAAAAVTPVRWNSNALHGLKPTLAACNPAGA